MSHRGFCARENREESEALRPRSPPLKVSPTPSSTTMLSPERRQAIQLLQRQQMAMKTPLFSPPDEKAREKKREAGAKEMTASVLRLLSSKVASRDPTSEGGSVRSSFLAWDKASRGYLIDLDLAAVLATFGVFLNAAELVDLLIAMDRDGDGRINFDDFATTMASVPPEDRAARGGHGVIERRAITALPIAMTVAGATSKGGAAAPGSQLKGKWDVDSPLNTIKFMRDRLRAKYPTESSGHLVPAFLHYQGSLWLSAAASGRLVDGTASGPLDQQSLRLAPPLPLQSCGSACRLVGPGATNWTHGIESPSGFRSDLSRQDFGSSCENVEESSGSIKVLPAQKPYLTIAALLQGLQMDQAASPGLTLARLWELCLPFCLDARSSLGELTLSASSSFPAGLASTASLSGTTTAATTVRIDGRIAERERESAFASPLLATVGSASALDRTTLSSATTRVFSPSPLTSFDASMGSSDRSALSVAAMSPTPLPAVLPSAVETSTASTAVPSLPGSAGGGVRLVGSSAAMPVLSDPASPLLFSSAASQVLSSSALQALCSRVGMTSTEFADFATGSFDLARGISFSEDEWRV